MSNVSGIGDAYYWSVFKIAEAFGLHRDTVKKRLLAANTPVAATVRGNPVYRPRRGDRVVYDGQQWTVTRHERFNGKPMIFIE